MPRGNLTINGKDAYATWGLIINGSALSTLMTPAPTKDYITSSSRLESGARADYGNVRIASREVTITFYISAKSETDFLAKYASFCEELKLGLLVLHTTFQPDVYYRMRYVSCSQFSEYNMELAEFALKLTEDDPTNRASESKY